MLLEFYGEECPHCIKMKPLVARLEKEGLKIEKYETWHDEKNESERLKYDKNLCGGVPFFYNTENDKYICGYVPYEELKAWAAGGEGGETEHKSLRS